VRPHYSISGVFATVQAPRAYTKTLISKLVGSVMVADPMIVPKKLMVSDQG
jgi:hypothetical protein